MDLRQAYKILEIPRNSPMPEVKQAYRDLAQVWHPDRHTQNERLQRKALEKIKELNAAYKCICLHLDAERATGSTDNASNHGGSAEIIIVCPECGTKNRTRSPINRIGAKCGRCGTYLFREKRQSEAEWARRTLCHAGACTGVIDSTGRCTKCGRTYEEGTSTETRNQHKLRLHHKKAIVYGSVGIGILLLFLLVLSSLRFPSGDRTGLQNSPAGASAERGRFEPDAGLSAPAPQPLSVAPSEKLDVPIELEPIDPSRLGTDSAPHTGGIRSGHSEITVDNVADTDAVVRVVRFRDRNQEKVRSFYIRSTDRFVANLIPPGEYVLRVAFGKDWDSETKKFNYRQSFAETQRFTVEETAWTEASEDRNVLRTRSSKLSITLDGLPLGNFQSHPINENEFWQ
ncbi:MAG: DnaJ domain-containing protein [Syntrophales bacterium]|jgi:hypothetical protein